MALTADEVRSEYESRGLSPSDADIASEIDNASRYGDDWAAGQFLANLDERAYRPTASAGGVGGDIDLNGDGNIDPGWFLVSDGGDPGFVQDASQATSDQYVVAVGGTNAADAVAASAAASAFLRDTNEAVRVEIDRLNLTGAFDDASGSSDAGIAAARATTGARITAAAGARFLGLIGTEPRVVTSANAAPGQSVTHLAPVTSAGTTLAIPGVANRGVATGSRVPTSTAGGVVTTTPAPGGGLASAFASSSGGGFSPIMLGAVALAAYVLFK